MCMVDMLYPEIGIAAVVGVGHGGLMRMKGKIVGHATNLLQVAVAARLAPQGSHILVVHTNDKVEPAEIRWRELSRTARHVVTVARSVAAHAAVGQVAHMPVANTRRVDAEPVPHPALLGHCLKNGLGSRRAANVTQTDKQNACGAR